MNPKSYSKKNSKKKIQFDIPSEFFIKGKEMTEVYYNLFIFENIFRSFIEILAKNEFGQKYWKKLIINKKIQEKIDERQVEERSKRWLSIRGNSDLFYTDLIELKTIISSNWDIFKEFFPKEVWITSKLEDLYDLRNKIAHNSYLNNDEQNTLKALITNIYSQMESKQKYRTILEPKREEIESVDFDGKDYLIIEEVIESKLLEIDFELINTYLQMIDKAKIANEQISDNLSFINSQISRIRRQEALNQNDLVNIRNLCKILCKFMKNNDDYIKRRVLDILENLTELTETKEILKNICYRYLIQLFEEGIYCSDLFRILDSFNYFDDLESLLVRAIDQENEGLLNDIYNGINFSKFKDKRIEIIRTLSHKLQSIHQDKKHLKDRIRQTIRKLENL